MANLEALQQTYAGHVPAAQSVAAKLGPGGGEFETEEDRFVSSCLDFLTAWCKVHANAGSEQPAVFIHHNGKDLPPSIGIPARRLGFKESVPLDVTKQILFCNENLKDVRGTAATIEDSSGALEFIEQNSLSKSTAIVFIPAQKVILIHRRGADLDAPERHEIPTGSAAEFDFSEIDKVLDYFDELFLGTDHACCRIWKKSAKRSLKEGAESTIQGCLIAHFKLLLSHRGVKTDYEVHTNRGREDVRLLKWVDGKWQTLIIELKVLRAGKTEAANLEWAHSGVAQLIGYRKDEASPICYLACYDGRNTDVFLDEVKQAANDANIVYRQHYLATANFPAATA